MRRLRLFLAYWLSRVGIAAGRFLPPGFCYAVSRPIAGLCFVVMARERRNLIANLTRVVGAEQAPGVAREVFRSFARYVIDLYQTPSRGPEALRRRLAFADWQRLDAALDAPQGALFVTLHLGQIELGAAAVAAQGHPVNVIADTLAYQPMDDLIQGLRAGLNLNVIRANKARSDVLRCLNRGEVLVMMLDSVEPGQGVDVDFFGAPAAMASAPSRVALRTGVRVLPAVICRDGDRLVPVVDFDLAFTPTGEEEADVRGLTQAMARSFERIIRRFPEQWYAMRPVWRDAGAAVDEDPAGSGAAWKVWSLWAGVHLGGLLPRSVAYGVARVAGDLAFYARAGVRRDVEDNMRHVLGPEAPRQAVQRAARDAFRNVARYYVDLIRVPRTPPATLLRRVRLHHFERLKARLDAGESVILATAHFGNPEVAVQAGAILGLNILILAEPLEPPALADLMTTVRRGYGPRYADAGFNGVADAIRQLRAGGGCLAITVDRDIQGNGVPLTFCGAETRLPLGAVELAARTGATIIPSYCRREGAGFDVYFEEPLTLVRTDEPKQDALVNAQALLQRVEPWLRADPGQWMVLERIWKPISALPQPRAGLRASV